MSDQPPEELVGVFELTTEIPDIGGVAGDRIVVRPWARVRPFGLVRAISRAEAWWALSDRCLLVATEPALIPSRLALRHFRETLSPHLTLLH